MMARPLLAAGVNLVFYAAGAFLLYRAFVWLWQDFYKFEQYKEIVLKRLRLFCD